MPFRDYEMSSKGHLHTLVQTQFKTATGDLEERVDFSQLPQDFKKCRPKKLMKSNIFLPGFWSLYISQISEIYHSHFENIFYQCSSFIKRRSFVYFRDNRSAAFFGL